MTDSTMTNNDTIMGVEHALRNDFFRAAPVTSTTRTATASLTQATPVYVLPEGVASNKREAFLGFLMLCGTSVGKDKGHWRTYIVTYIHAAISDLGARILANNSTAYAVAHVTEDTLDSVVDLVSRAGVWGLAREAAHQATAKEKFFSEFPALEDFPVPNQAVITAEYRKCLDIEVIYGHLSLVMFLAGKVITDRNRASITINRPRAIENKYGLGPTATLTGTMKLSEEAHTGINLAFTAMNDMRKVTFREMAKYGTETGSQGIEVLAVTTRLMAFAGMQHVKLIDSYLSATPNAIHIPMLRPSISHYVSSMKQLLAESVELRPYHKLIFGDTSGFFNRRNIEALLVVAITWNKQTQPSLEQYNLPDNADRILALYNANMAALEAANEARQHESAMEE